MQFGNICIRTSTLFIRFVSTLNWPIAKKVQLMLENSYLAVIVTEKLTAI